MAGETIYSDIITNINAGHPSLDDASLTHGDLHTQVAKYAYSAAGELEATDITQFFWIPSNARIISILSYNDDLDSHGTPTLAFNLGLYASKRFVDSNGTEYAANAVIDADAYASAATTWQAAASGTELSIEARDLNKIGQQVWQDAGLNRDPNTPLVIAATITTGAATFAAGDVVLVAKYTT